MDFRFTGFSEVTSRVVSSVQSQLTGMTAWVFKLQNFGTQMAQSAQQKLQKYMQTLIKSPSSKKDYWKVMNLYFSKRFVVMGTVISCVLGFLFFAYGYPWAEGYLWRATLRVDSEKCSTFSGKVKIIDTMGVTIFVGELDNGKPEGYGTQYDSDGNILYEGNFSSGKYNGEGKMYNSDGVVIYDGEFENNKYSGSGKLYSDIGRVTYVGEFSVGQKSGKGIDYDTKTQLRTYYGEFENGVRQGNGIVYEEDGETILYDGELSSGLYNGTGKLYSDGNLLYSGEFVNGLYDGEGNLYDLDTGALLYSGEFKEGLYDGTGKLYNSSGVVIYEGKFSSGKKQGDGTSYDSLGSQTFSGTFRSDSIDYIEYLGCTVDEVTAQFGQASYRTEVSNKLILTYLSLDAAIVFKVDSNKGSYVCEKVILGTQDEFMGLGAQSTAMERREVMGEPFSSINFCMPSYYTVILENLSININDTSSVPSDKYIMDQYFIRFYFNEGKTELKCIEICSM